ncbi:hypothetical protein SH449x_000849 [Pirellulaceae bacterium SH449]
MKKAILVSIDGLGTNMVGTYGNSLCPTPNMNALAARSIVLDQCWADSSNSLEVLTSLWSGTHKLNRESADYSEWIQWVGQGLLVTDDKRVLESPSANLFERVLLVDHQDLEDETEFEELLEAAMGAWVAESNMFSMLWIHSRGLRGVWDAPYDYRRIMCDEDDPEPPTDVTPITFSVNKSTDPDDVFGVACAIVGQVVVIDQALGELLGTLKELNLTKDTLFGLIGVSGYPLGEHGMVGGEAGRLYAEALQSPCIFRLGDSLPVGIRFPTIMQPNEIGDWIVKWLNSDPSEESEELIFASLCDESIDTMDRIGAAIAIAANECYVISPAWSCRITEGTANTQGGAELFAKPDDRWEQNEVSIRATAVVEKMHALRDKLVQAHTSGEEPGPVNWLDEELIKPTR